MPLEIHILTLFPRMFDGPFSESIVKRAVEKGLVRIHIHDIRGFTHDRHHTADDYQYGGGPGMVMKPEPVFEAVDHVRGLFPPEAWPRVPIVLLSPQGRRFTQRKAEELARRPGLVLICGHYQGVDERVRQHLATCDVSIGDYVLSGGEIPAMVVVDAVVRLVPGAVGDTQSIAEDSITSGLLQYPVYTRPAEYRGLRVPEILLSGNHQAIARWRREQSLLRTLRWRPDLLRRAPLTEEDLEFLRRHGYDPDRRCCVEEDSPDAC